jgi:hypothetical protein
MRCGRLADREYARIGQQRDHRFCASSVDEPSLSQGDGSIGDMIHILEGKIAEKFRHQPRQEIALETVLCFDQERRRAFPESSLLTCGGGRKDVVCEGPISGRNAPDAAAEAVIRLPL